MDFVTLDFETASHQKGNACEIGLTFVENNHIAAVKSWLIKPLDYPYFNGFNISVHGIRPRDVADEPTFDLLWNELIPLLNNKLIIAHNAAFDMGVLQGMLETYNLTFPQFEYTCSYVICKRVWPGAGAYDLKSLCNMNGISFRHHRAGDDSEATAKLVIAALQHAGVDAVDDMRRDLKLFTGKFEEGRHVPMLSPRGGSSATKIAVTGDTSKHKPDNMFYGRTVVFTGTLGSMKRAMAQQIIADIGGINSQAVTPSTDFLIIGQQDYRVVGEAGMSSKQKKAHEYIARGAHLEILSEDEFLKSI